MVRQAHHERTRVGAIHESPLHIEEQPGKQPLLAIVGPTAVGKTALSLALARAFPFEIVSVDSRKVYRGMDIGTAKPTARQRAEVAHHLIDVVDPDQEFSLARYLELAHPAIEAIYQRGKVPLLVGGTGQYLWALLEAWRVPSIPPDHQLRLDLEALAKAQGAGALHLRLAEIDPQSAERIDAQNVRRVIRALEVYHQTGVPASQMRGRGTAPFRACVIGLTLPRQELYRRIDQRVDRMVEQGWIGEVKALLSRGVSRDMPCMASVGYREMADYLAGAVALGDAIGNTKTSTHRFARHQYAWFRPSDPRITWLEAAPGVEERARTLVNAFLDVAG